MGIEGSVIRWLARKYQLDPNEEGSFDAGWSAAAVLARGEAKDVHLDGQLAEVKQAAHRLKAAVTSTDGDDEPGRAVTRIPASRKVVVFSDHHMTYRGHRQDWFVVNGNAKLYCDALEQYLEKDYVLVENGDVEEVLIFDPKDHQGEFGARAEIVANAGEDALRIFPEALRERRERVRLQVLERILTEPGLADYRKLVGQFVDKGDFVRVGGNHDYMLQRAPYRAVYEEHLGKHATRDLPGVVDYCVLHEAGDTTKAQYVICHGHQFDLTTNPAYAERFGETFSETAATWFHGADRRWRWSLDFPSEWIAGTVGVTNHLVDDGAEDPDVQAIVDGFASSLAALDVEPDDDELLEELAELEQALIDDPDVHEEIVDPAGLGSSKVRRRRWWMTMAEGIFHHAVGWEHFRHDPRFWKMLKELLKEDRFFKYRHTDELLACQLMREAWEDDTPPVLVLGHTHEPRLDAKDGDGHVEKRYLNSGAAGRFENLLWALEIHGDDVRLVSWHRPNQDPDRAPERREWTPREVEGSRPWRLFAGNAAVDVP